MRAKRIRTRRHSSHDQQRQPFFDKRGAEEQAQFFAGPRTVQAKLAIGKSNDPLEKEADTAARRVMDQQVQRAGQKDEEVKKKPDLQRQGQKEEEQTVQKSGKEEDNLQARYLQRREDKKMDEEAVQAKAVVQAESGNDYKQEEGEVARPSLEALLRQRKGRGFPLPDDLRAEMEQKFRADFREVRVHTDEEAGEMCDSIHAQAFTFGYDIYFNNGNYVPSSTGGKELLAHELAHVVQQKG